MATTYTDIMTVNESGAFKLPDALRTIYSAELEFTSRPQLVYDQFVETKDDFRVRKGQQAYWTIFRHLPPAIGTLTSNVDVDGGSIQDFQVSLTVDEYGYSIGTVEELDLTSYFGPISDIVRNVLAPQVGLTLDTLSRNAHVGSGSTYRLYGGTATSRATLATTSVFTPDLVRRAAYDLSIRRIPLVGSGYVCVTHPTTIYELRNSSYWIDAQRYAGSQAIFSGEEGTLHGVRFIKSDRARIENGGAITAQSGLTTAAKAGDAQIVVGSTTNFLAGQEISLIKATTSNSVNIATDEVSEPVVIDTVVDGTTLNLKTKLLNAHAVNSRVVEAVDVYVSTFLGATPAVGKGVVLAPEVRVALPTDKLRRIHYVGWYGLMGYGVLRDWALENIETASAVGSAPAFPY